MFRFFSEIILGIPFWSYHWFHHDGEGDEIKLIWHPLFDFSMSSLYRTREYCIECTHVVLRKPRSTETHRSKSNILSFPLFLAKKWRNFWMTLLGFPTEKGGRFFWTHYFWFICLQSSHFKLYTFVYKLFPFQIIYILFTNFQDMPGFEVNWNH